MQLEIAREMPQQPVPPVEQVVLAQCYRYSCAAYLTKDGRWMSLDDNVELLDVVRYYLL